MRTPTILLAAVTMLGAGTGAPPFAPATDMAKDWPGAWTCVLTASNQRQPTTYPVEAATYGKWLRLSASVPAAAGRPANRFIYLTTYDSAAKKWFNISYSTSGQFQVSNSSAGPDAVRQTWTYIYPLDPNSEPGTIVMGPASLDSYHAHGNRVAFHTSCTKRT